MAIINSYPTATPTTGDLLIGTDTSTTPNSTKTFTVSSISALVNKGYKSLIAKWSQGGGTSTPVLDTPIVNDTGLTFSFEAYSTTGIYDLKPSVNFTDVSKIYAVVSSYADEAGFARLISVKEISPTRVRITNISLATQALANGVTNGQIEIRIYE
tara:strand:+ start:434 stop:901 length:468 start_codon:yes stop_codon:yes gene_type:complete